jgi:hydrogenase nickel incorporation protein HypB
MCTVCGCSGVKIESDADSQARGHAHRHDRDCGHEHDRHHGHEHGHDHDHQNHKTHGDHHRMDRARDNQALHYGAGLASVHLSGMTQDRIIRVERDILAKNDGYAAENRDRLSAVGVFGINLMSSPGAGKTTLLVKTITDLSLHYPIIVIEGDQQTSYDAERIRATGAQAVQVNTGKGCHLDAHMVGHALDRLPLQTGGLLFIENVGNLVCPAAFDLGERSKVVVLSVTEGEDKPLKYPDMFAACDLMLITKIDLLPHVEFDFDRTVEFARRVNPRIEVMPVSARTGEGLLAFYAWLKRCAADAVGEAK